MNFLDKAQKYIIEFDEETQSWICVSEDLQKEGKCEIAWLPLLDQDLAPALAMMDCAGYDIRVIAAQLELI